MIQIRAARPDDAPAICEVFHACYGGDYPYPEFLDVGPLTRVIYSDDTLVLVAEDSESGRIVGTASVLLEVGAYSDLVGEFGRLAVHPDARQQGVGKRLMAGRLEQVRNRLHVGLVEARVAHPYSLKIAESHGFHVVGYLPRKLLLGERESLLPLVRHFSGALELRRNHPRVIPEAGRIADHALLQCGISPDVVIDEDAPAYPSGGEFEIERLTTEGYASLLRIERGRTRRREVFGPLRLHYGFFKLAASHSHYLIARQGDRVVGAAGIMFESRESAARLFELIALDDDVVRFLLEQFVRQVRDTLAAEYVEVDVNAHSPRMQRTLLECGFLPAAYVPAYAFHEVERIDIIKMVRLFTPLGDEPPPDSRNARRMSELVLEQFRRQEVLPRVAEAMRLTACFEGLGADQARRLASVCAIADFPAGRTLFHAGSASDELYLVLRGRAAVHMAEREIGTVGPGESLGEVSFFANEPRHATAIATTHIEAVVIRRPEFAALVRQRPDIGLVVYANLAVDSGRKLLRSDSRLAAGLPARSGRREN